MTEEQEKLVIDNMRLVYHLIKKYNYDEDYASVGMIGLIKGVKNFDPNKGYKISSYLCKCITNEIACDYRKVKKCPLNPLSIENTYITDNITLSECVEDESINLEKDLIEKETKLKLKNAISKLDEKDRYLILSLYGLYGYEKKKQIDLVEKYNCTQGNLSRKHKQILKKLKQIMESDKIDI